MRWLVLLSPLLQSPQLPAQLSITSQPILAIDATSPTGDMVIGQISGATRFADGSLLVLDGSEMKVRRFSAIGAARGASGRQGDGPGEFRFPTWAGRCGDTAYIFDPVLRRISAFSSRDTSRREIRLAEQRDVPLPHDDIRCLMSGGFAYFVDSRSEHGAATPGSLQTSDLLIVREDGTLVRRVTGITGAALVAFGNRAIPHPLSGRPRLGSGTGGIRYGTGSSAMVWSVAGTSSPRAIAVAIPPRRSTREAVNAAIDMVLERFPAADRPNFRTMYAAAPVPASAPFYRRLIVDTEGLIWLETSLPGSISTIWVVSNDAGVAIATVELPGRVELYEVGRDYLIGRLVSEDGVERIVVHGVRRR